MPDDELGDAQARAEVLLPEARKLVRYLEATLALLAAWDAETPDEDRGLLDAVAARINRRLAWLARMQRAIADIGAVSSSSSLSEAAVRTEHLQHEASFSQLRGRESEESPVGLLAPPRFRVSREETLVVLQSFIDTDDASVAERYSRALRELLELADYEIVVEGRDEWGSWLKSWVTRARKSDAPRKLAQGVAQAASDTYMRQPGAAATKDLAEAVSTALAAMGDNEGCQVFDNLIVLKLRDSRGQFKTIAKELSIEERALIRERPAMLTEPSKVLAQLQDAVSLTQRQLGSVRQLPAPAADASHTEEQP